MVVARYFEGEAVSCAERVLDSLGFAEAFVPAAWPLELGNGLLLVEIVAALCRRTARTDVWKPEEFMASRPPPPMLGCRSTSSLPTVMWRLLISQSWNHSTERIMFSTYESRRRGKVFGEESHPLPASRHIDAVQGARVASESSGRFRAGRVERTVG